MWPFKPLSYRKLRSRMRIPEIHHRNPVRLSFIRLGIFFDIKSQSIAYSVAFFLGLANAFALLLFVKGPGLYSGGVSGITQGIARIVYAQTHNEILFTLLFWGLFIVVNIPLFIFAWIKLSRRFAYKTVIYSLTSTGAGLAMDFLIPDGNFVRHIFSDALLIAQSAEVDSRLAEAQRSGISMMSWYGDGAKSAATGAAIMITAAYVLCSSLCTGFFTACVYILGGSGGGTDIFAFYWAESRKKPLSSVVSAVNLGSFFVGYLIGSYVAFGTASADWSAHWLFSPILVLSFINVRGTLAVYMQLFPKDKAIEAVIVSEVADTITENLKRKNYNHGITIVEAYGGFSGRSKKMLYTTLRYSELLQVAGWIAAADPKAFVQLRPVLSVVGAFSSKTIREREGR